MIRRSLSIFSFNRPISTKIGHSISVAVWIAASLVLIDLLINVLFAYPTDPKNLNPSKLQTYFEYGRSVEGKLARMTRRDPSQTAPITLTGWYIPLGVEENASRFDRPVVSFYGMSHAVQLANALGRTSDQLIPRVVGAPGASANWAYGAYLRDRGGTKSRVVVLALMSANLPMITSIAPITWNVDSPMPYTADRFYLDNDQLSAFHPTITSFQEYADAFYNPAKWSAFRSTLHDKDPIYDSFIVESSVLDHSSLFRLVRRAYSQRAIRNFRHNVLDQTGYHDSEQVEIARAIIKQFAEQARKDRMLPVIYIVNNFGYADYLFQALKPTLEANDIPYLNSASIASPNDPRKYLSNSHFTDEIDDQMARSLSSLIQKRL
jgi:hypothetical protein